MAFCPVTFYPVAFCPVTFCPVAFCPGPFVPWHFILWHFIPWHFVPWYFVRWHLVGTLLGSSMFWGVSHAPVPRERGLIVPNNFGTPMCAQIVWPRTRKLISHVGSSVFLGGQPHPRPDRAGSRHPQIYGASYMCAHSMRNNQISHDDHTRCEENFAGSTTNADSRSVCGS